MNDAAGPEAERTGQDLSPPDGSESEAVARAARERSEQERESTVFRPAKIAYPRSPSVVVLDEQSSIEIDTDRWQRLASRALQSAGVVDGELNLIFVDEIAMTQLNRQHMGKNTPTDVLSFPLDGSAVVELGESLIGDVVVCTAQAAAQAREHEGHGGHDGSVDDELALLIVHGVLHVLGHDHYNAATTNRMQSCEQALLRQHHRA